MKDSWKYPKGGLAPPARTRVSNNSQIYGFLMDWLLTFLRYVVCWQSRRSDSNSQRTEALQENKLSNIAKLCFFKNEMKALISPLNTNY